jgi:hypothetical protein
MKWIILTDKESKRDVYVQVSHISRIERIKEVTWVHIGGKTAFRVFETPKEIMEEIAGGEQ